MSLKISVPDFASSLPSITYRLLVSIYLTLRIPNDYGSQGIRIMKKRVDETDVAVLAEALRGRHPSVACGARAKVGVANEEGQHKGSAQGSHVLGKDKCAGKGTIADE